MKRRGDWEGRLEAFIFENRGREFSWGRWDCCLFVGGAIEAMTGTDAAADFRGSYDSPRAARDLMLDRAGTKRFSRFVERMAACYGMAEIPTRLARRGDMVLMATGAARRSLGIVALDGRNAVIVGAAHRGPDGLGLVSLAMCLRAWRI